MPALRSEAKRRRESCGKRWVGGWVGWIEIEGCGGKGGEGRTNVMGKRRSLSTCGGLGEREGWVGGMSVCARRARGWVGGWVAHGLLLQAVSLRRYFLP